MKNQILSLAGLIGWIVLLPTENNAPKKIQEYGVDLFVWLKKMSLLGWNQCVKVGFILQEWWEDVHPDLERWIQQHTNPKVLHGIEKGTEMIRKGYNWIRSKFVYEFTAKPYNAITITPPKEEWGIPYNLVSEETKGFAKISENVSVLGETDWNDGYHVVKGTNMEEFVPSQNHCDVDQPTIHHTLGYTPVDAFAISKEEPQKLKN